MSQIYKAASSQSGIVFSITGVSPIQANGVSGVAQTGNVSVSIIEAAPAYTNVTFLMSPYTVLSTDYFISVDSSGGPVTINLPNAPTTNQQFIIKDRLGQSLVNNITIKSLGGVTTIDQQASYTFVDNFESLECLYNSSNYEVF